MYQEALSLLLQKDDIIAHLKQRLADPCAAPRGTKHPAKQTKPPPGACKKPKFQSEKDILRRAGIECPSTSDGSENSLSDTETDYD